jgi:hypothetical protein
VALDASQLLGSPQLAGVKVNPLGMARRVSRGVAGQLPTRIAYGPSTPTTPDTPEFGRLAYIAVTQSELALIKLRSGIVRVFLDEVVERIPRSEVASAELGGGVAPSLTITFSNGEGWTLEVPRPSKGSAKAVVDVLSHRA